MDVSQLDLNMNLIKKIDFCSFIYLHGGRFLDSTHNSARS
jgi:hypothetical protein